ncbi:response regulator transcription factor [Flavobacterium sp.]
MIKTSLVIVEDHVLISNAFSELIGKFENYTVLYECANGKQLVKKFEEKNNIPLLVLLDVNMPEMNGFETALWLKEHHPEVLVLVISLHEDEQTVVQMIKNGCRGYISKQTTSIDLKLALDAMTERKMYYPDWVSSILSSNLSKESTNQLVQPALVFSFREKEFLKLCITDMTYKKMSEVMFCSPRTVESYRDSLFVKLNLCSRTGLAVYAVKNGFE